MTPPDSGLAATVACLRRLTPSDIDRPKRRLGLPRDGGYIVVDDLDPVTLIYGFGVGPEISFEMDLAALGKPSLLFDPFVPGLPQAHALTRWQPRGLAPSRSPDGIFAALPELIAEHGHEDETDMLLKIDIEGMEWEVLPTLSPATLGQFRQILLEVHNLRMLTDPSFRQQVARGLDALLDRFVLCHVHANNCAGVHLLDGLPCPDVLELTWVRRDTVAARASATVFPTPLDRPNEPARPDYPLWYFPFLPDKAGPGAFEASLHAADPRAGAP